MDILISTPKYISKENKLWIHIKQRDKFYQVVDMVTKENEELRKRQSEGKDLDKPRPMGFNINSLAEQWYKLKQENRFKRRF